MNFDKSDTAVLVTDPQNDVLSEMSSAWGLVGNSIKENRTIENIERLFEAAKKNGFAVFTSPHYYYPADQSWRRHEIPQEGYLVTDPQNDVLSEAGAAWGGEGRKENKTVESIERLFQAATKGAPRFSFRLTTALPPIAPGKPAGPVETMMQGRIRSHERMAGPGRT